MLTDENAAILKDWADEVQRVELALSEAKAGRDAAIRGALSLGAGVGEIVSLTGLTRARIYQLKVDPRRE